MNTFLVFFMGACLVCWAGAELYEVYKRTRRNRYRVRRVDPRCERTGSQSEFYRRLRTRGAK